MIRSNILVRRLASFAISKQMSPAISVASSTISSLSSLSSIATPLLTKTPTNFALPPSFPSSSPSTPSLPTSTPSPRTFSTASKELRDILQREIDEEDEASSEFNHQMPPELAELYSDMGKEWTILEGITGIGGIGGGDSTGGSGGVGGGASVRMFRKEPGSNGSKIGIVFHCQDTEDDVDDMMFDEMEDGGEGEEDENAVAVRFGVTVSKGGKTLVLQCRSSREGLNVETVTAREGDTEAVLMELAGGEGIHAALYQGPEVTELAEDLQEALNRYVEKECGVNTDVAAFIGMYADYREQEEYVSWMKTAIKVLA